MKNQVSIPSIFTTIAQAKEGMKLKDNFCAFTWLLTVQGILPGGDWHAWKGNFHLVSAKYLLILLFRHEIKKFAPRYNLLSSVEALIT